MTIAIVWFRQDLRLTDNPALYQASLDCHHIIPLFINEDNGNSGLLPNTSQASHVWLHHSLTTLNQSLINKQSKLLIKQGNPITCLKDIVEKTNATHLYWNRRYDPISIATDKRIKEYFKSQLIVRSFHANLLIEPWQLLNQADKPYRVFTPYWKKLSNRLELKPPLPAPETIPCDPQKLKSVISLTVDELHFLPKQAWANNMMHYWDFKTGEDAAHERLNTFLNAPINTYKTKRDFPAQASTSQLSPHLHFGEISPNQIVHTVKMTAANDPASHSDTAFFLREIAWRDFAYYTLYHSPSMLSKPLDKRFDQFSWRDPSDYQDDLQRWKKGETGFPMIDAGMRELWHTGWMHNRLRMITASFLTKNLLIPWQVGEQWFRDTLIDADIASNTFGWQWVAGCGADAAPYFRIFNPLLQGKKFDVDANYIKQWIPELKSCSAQILHKPPIKKNHYPSPIIDLNNSRKQALQLFSNIKG